MAHSQQQWRSGKNEMAWLSSLVNTFEKLSCEKLSRPDFRTVPCEPAVLQAAKAHLARPACPHNLYGSDFSFRN